MVLVDMVMSAKDSLLVYLSNSNRSNSEIAIVTTAVVAIGLLLRYPDRAIGSESRPELGKKSIKGWPLLGNLPELIRFGETPLEMMQKNFETFGDIYAMTIPIRGRLFFVNTPEMMEHILKTRFENYIKGDVFREVSSDILGRGIFVADQEQWRFHRKTASSIFTTKLFRQVVRGAFKASAIDLCDVLIKEGELRNKPVDLQQSFLKMTMDVFGKMTFGLDFQALKHEGPHEFGDAFDYCTTLIDERITNPFFRLTHWFIPGKNRRSREAIAVLDRYAAKAIEDRRNETEEEKANRAKDLLDHFINYATEDGTTLTPQDLRDVFVNFMVAGRDTTALTLSWQFYYILSQPRVLKNIMKEIQIVLNGSEDITYELLMNELPYLKSVMHETLRLAAIVPRNGKVAVDDDVLPDGTQVRKGDLVGFSTWCMGRNRRVWGEDAAIFVPERWLVDEEDENHEQNGDATHTKAKSTPMHGHGKSPFGKFRMENQFKFNSFNAGPRLCLGQTFATLEAMETTVILLLRLKLELAPGQELPTYRGAATLTMKNPFLVMVKSLHREEPGQGKTIAV
ncbi:hypothetical protein BGW38_000718 [Lunasporangiospora selenospora]|uniref:Cytochrome P450 n=1 Tax=Lunasporangiospora selenospora TaxID=979761 RepID=A0A9P6KE05_9FUNG|nr:hypothetical protein BGW38_000718 [Lunasporangiospora selenospora]